MGTWAAGKKKGLKFAPASPHTIPDANECIMDGGRRQANRKRGKGQTAWEKGEGEPLVRTRGEAERSREQKRTAINLPAMQSS